jgi:hypothetical protein
MRYPCSYIIYPPGFEGLPPAVKHAVYARIAAVVSGRASVFFRSSSSCEDSPRHHSRLFCIRRDELSGGAAPLTPHGVGAPHALFPAIPNERARLEQLPLHRTKDAQRFLVHARPQQSSVAPLTVVVNWTAMIQK